MKRYVIENYVAIEDYDGKWMEYSDYETDIKQLTNDITECQAMFLEKESENYRLKEQNKRYRKEIWYLINKDKELRDYFCLVTLEEMAEQNCFEGIEGE